MKWLLFAVLLVIHQTPLPVPRKATNGADSRPQTVTEKAQNNKTPTTPPPPILNAVPANQDQNATSTPQTKNTEQAVTVSKLLAVSVRRDWADWVLWGFNGLLVIAGFLAIWVGYKTLKTISRQTDATEKSAKGALLNAQAVINTERPWLDVASNFPPRSPLRFFECFNRGNTPAKLIIATADHCFVENLDDLPTIPTYSNPIVWPDSHLLVRDESIQLCPSGVSPYAIIEQENMQALIEQSRQFLVYYGHIIYRDVLYPESSSEGIHSTRWCYVWRPAELRFVKSGPQGYNEYT